MSAFASITVAFLIGLFLGGLAGFLMAALCHVASHADERINQEGLK